MSTAVITADRTHNGLTHSSDISTDTDHPSRSLGLQLEKDVIAWTDSIHEQVVTDKERERENKDTFKLLDYLQGKQWAANARYARSRPVINKTFRHFWENVGLLTDLALDFQIKLFDKLNGFSDFEHLINQLATHWAERNDFEATLSEIVCYGLLHTGYCKTQWNSSLNGGMGDVEMIPVAPWNVACIGAGRNVQESECVDYFHLVTREHLVRTYGKTALRVTMDVDGDSSGSESLRPPGISRESWSRMAEPLKRALGEKGPQAVNRYPLAMQKEFWLRDDSVNESRETKVVGNPLCNWSYLVEPGERLYPRGRVIVTAGGCVMDDQPNPYWHAQFPFSTFRPFRVPWSFNGMSPIRPLLQLNNIINRVNGGVLDIIKSTIEPTLIAPKAAFPPADWDALDPGAPGGKIKYNNNSPKAPEFQKRGEVPGWVFTYLDSISKAMEEGSGSSAISQALGKKQVPGGDALEQIKSSKSTPIRIQSRALESFLRDAGYMGVCNILQFYSVAHRVAILGAQGLSSADFRPMYGHALPAGMKPESFVRRFQFVLKPGSLLASQKDQKISFAMELQKRGVLSSQGLFRVLDQNFDVTRNKMELIEEAKIKIMVAGAAAAATGKGHK